MLSVPPGAYPIRGFAYLCSQPSVLVRVSSFLAGVSALCVAGVGVLVVLTFRAQLSFVGHSLLGVGVLGKVVTCLLILTEASLAVYLIFKQTMHILQKQLFQEVLHSKPSECCLSVHLSCKKLLVNFANVLKAN